MSVFFAFYFLPLGCSIFENCKRCNNGTWGPRDDFFVNGEYCSECRPGWSGGDCMSKLVPLNTFDTFALNTVIFHEKSIWWFLLF